MSGRHGVWPPKPDHAGELPPGGGAPPPRHPRRAARGPPTGPGREACQAAAGPQACGQGRRRWRRQGRLGVAGAHPGHRGRRRAHPELPAAQGRGPGLRRVAPAPPAPAHGLPLLPGREGHGRGRPAVRRGGLLPAGHRGDADAARGHHQPSQLRHRQRAPRAPKLHRLQASGEGRGLPAGLLGGGDRPLRLPGRALARGLP
mmetsp:Transcript_28834/g.82610  ORF Transcript_28834/g.82610 Transcript_28834/m.82610 type:complete len:202 (+) Transcript_28834:51-656(+)